METHAMCVGAVRVKVSVSATQWTIPHQVVHGLGCHGADPDNIVASFVADMRNPRPARLERNGFARNEHGLALGNHRLSTIRALMHSLHIARSPLNCLVYDTACDGARRRKEATKHLFANGGQFTRGARVSLVCSKCARNSLQCTLCPSGKTSSDRAGDSG
jgi:hypothetical protein